MQEEKANFNSQKGVYVSNCKTLFALSTNELIFKVVNNFMVGMLMKWLCRSAHTLLQAIHDITTS